MLINDNIDLDDSKDSESAKYQRFISNFNYSNVENSASINRPHIKIPSFPRASLKSLKCYEVSPNSKRKISFTDITPLSSSFNKPQNPVSEDI